MDETNWTALEKVAANCGCLYSGQPSWRRLLTLIARGVLVVSVQDKFGLHRRRTRYKDADERAERDRLRQERQRRAAGIPPRGAQEALDQATGYRDEFGQLTEPA